MVLGALGEAALEEVVPAVNGNRIMQRLLLIALIGLTGLSAVAQTPYFIYLQTEPAQSFAIVFKEQTVHSSASGYIILPNLTDSVLQFVVRFPEKKHPDHPFVIRAQRNDQGYLLKDYGDKGWGLLDWRTLSVTYAERPGLTKTNVVPTEGQADFATMLAKASGDSTLLLESSTSARNTTTKSAAAANKSTPANAKSDTAIASKPIAIAKPSNEAKPDTVSITSPVAEVKPVQQSKPVVADAKPAEAEKPSQTKQPATIPIPGYCNSILTDAEFTECLGKVQVARSETSKVNVLRDFMGGRCYTIEQVKALAQLLSTDEVRYDFLLEAWSHTAERSRYLVLASIFEDPATANRFKEMFQ